MIAFPQVACGVLSNATRAGLWDEHNVELCQWSRPSPVPNTALLPSLNLGKPWLQQEPPLFSHDLLPMPSLLTQKRHRASNMGRTLRPIEVTNLAAIVVHRLRKSYQGIGDKQGLKRADYLGYVGFHLDNIFGLA